MFRVSMSRVSCPVGIPQNVAPDRVPWCCQRLFTALKVRHQFHRLWFLDFFETRVLFQGSLYWWLLLPPYSNMIAFRMSYCGNNTSAFRVRLLKFFLQGRSETPGRPFKPVFFELFEPRTGLANVFEGTCPNCGTFSEKFFGVWKLGFTSIFHIIPVMS